MNLLVDDPEFGYIRKLEKIKEKEKENPGTCFQVSINSNQHGCFWGVKFCQNEKRKLGLLPYKKPFRDFFKKFTKKK